MEPPFPARCRLQSLIEGDLPHLVALDTDPGVRAFLGGPVEPAEAMERSRQLIDAGDAAMAWAIRPRTDDRVMGIVYLHPHHHGEETEISFALLPEYQGQGYATEASRIVLHHAFHTLKLDKVVAETQAANHKSLALLARLGMEPREELVRFGERQILHELDAERFLRQLAAAPEYR